MMEYIKINEVFFIYEIVNIFLIIGFRSQYKMLNYGNVPRVITALNRCYFTKALFYTLNYIIYSKIINERLQKLKKNVFSYSLSLPKKSEQSVYLFIVIGIMLIFI